MEFPTRSGISVPLSELYLPESRLDLRRPENYNNHHGEWERRQMGRFAITQTLRDLDRHQFVIPKDTHRYIHETYAPPKFPTLREAMDEVDAAYQNGEHMKVYLIDQKRYVEHPISSIHMKTLEAEYNQYAQ